MYTCIWWYSDKNRYFIYGSTIDISITKVNVYISNPQLNILLHTGLEKLRYKRLCRIWGVRSVQGDKLKQAGE